MPNMMDEAAGMLTPEQLELLTARLDALPRPTFRDELVRAEAAARQHALDQAMFVMSPAWESSTGRPSVGLQALVDAPADPDPRSERATYSFWRNSRNYAEPPVMFSEEARVAMDTGLREAFDRCAVGAPATSEPEMPRRLTATEAAAQVRMPGLTVAQIAAVSYPAVLSEMRRASNQWAESAFLRELERSDAPIKYLTTPEERVQTLIDRALNRETVKVGDGISTAMYERMRVQDAQTSQLRFCPSRMILERRDGTSRHPDLLNPLVENLIFERSELSQNHPDRYVTSAPILVNMQTDNPRRLGVVSSVDSAPTPVRNGTVGSRLREAARRLRESTVPTTRRSGVTTSGT